MKKRRRRNRTGLINDFQPGRHAPQGLDPALFHVLKGTAEEAAEEVTSEQEACPQRLKPDSSQGAYRSAEALRHPKSNATSSLWLVLAWVVLFLGPIASAQIYLPKPAPEPSEYGKVILDNAKTGPGAVVFDHWLHRSMYTCRVCHVDVGFAMESKASGITARTNREGFHCGACHDGKKVFEGEPIFPACADVPSKECSRCHSQDKKGARKYEYKKFTAKFPKGVYGVNWEAAEKSGIIKPVDFVEGLSSGKPKMHNRQDLSVTTAYPWVYPVTFSHEKHSIWNGCELCHPEIFPTAQKETIHFSMFYNLEGRYCGACHGKVAFPLNNCQGCHSRAPLWAP
jgi:c(7)-type cytochrome triheme protein